MYTAKTIIVQPGEAVACYRFHVTGFSTNYLYRLPDTSYNYL